jgi:hypothetical protein
VSAPVPPPALSILTGAPIDDVCEGCLEEVPLEQLVASRRDKVTMLLLCDRCLEKGKDAPSEKLPVPADLGTEIIAKTGVHPKHLRVLMRWIEGGRFCDATAAEGMAGTGAHTLAVFMERFPKARDAFRELLRLTRQDPVYLAKKLKLAQNAMKPFYHPGTQQVSWIPDNATRLRAVELAMRAHGITLNEKGGAGAVTVIINENIDSDEESSSVVLDADEFKVEVNLPAKKGRPAKDITPRKPR